jgi:hypothetical protein
MATVWKGTLALAAAAGLAWGERTVPATFYIDSETGDDTAAGTRENAAWRSLEKANAAALIPGDRVLFRRGGLWRGQLSPQGGGENAPILYGTYGTGAKPILQGSVSRDRPEDWAEASPGVWATRKFDPEPLERFADLADSVWRHHAEGGAKVSFTREQTAQAEGRAFYRIACTEPGGAGNHIQVWGPEVAGPPACLVLRLRARSTVPFSLSTVETLLNRAPYTCALRGTAGRTAVGPEWQTLEVILLEQQKLGASHLHFNLGGMIPAGAVFEFEPVGLWRARIAPRASIDRDVGIVILNHGEAWGVKKWTLADVKAPLDYWYDPDGKRVFLACGANPAARFKSVELALTRHIVSQGAGHGIVYDGLAVRYGGAHGFGGGNTRRIVIRNCDISWIGGGLQHWGKRADGTPHPVRYGNAIEFWGAAQDHLVERNRIWEVYDAALTNQGNGENSNQLNITYRDNVIWNAEYSFEFWNRPEAALTRNIVFEHNTCVDAGHCWSHSQRPDPNGAHLMFYHNPSATTGFIVRNNIFVRSTDRCTRLWNGWNGGLAMQNNLYWSPDKPIIRWQEKTEYPQSAFARYQADLGLDAGSLVAEPQFVDPAARDYRLKPGSPGTALATDGGPVGARLERLVHE